MLTIDIKNRLIQILKCILELHSEILLSQNENTLLTILHDCQSAAINVGETLETDADNADYIIHILEDYCEALYLMTQDISISNEWINQLNISIKAVIDFVKLQKSKYRVVFFPYKASMWDSLESIWIACSKDKRCECRVVPIPYFEFDQQTGSAQCCYELTDFPDYVPVRNYLNYDVTKERPDIAYIHNPYDNFNYVTSVHPDYYSKRLKEHVRKLVYVPYYVTSGQVSEHHKFLPVYTQMDYMIAQSETFKHGFIGLPYYNKILALGSPKFDRIIQKISNTDLIPDSWKIILDGKKAVMLNTSINCFLSSGEIMLEKIGKVFKVFEMRKDVILIWRPHPLMEATISSMRPELKASYDKLMIYFKQNKIGILDNTPDITNTVAISDAYIGENSSSVVNLFEVAGKPVFILDNYTTERFSEDEKRTIIIADMVKTHDNDWIIPLQYNGIFKMEQENWDNINFIHRFSGQPIWACTYISALERDGKIYLSPYDATEAVCYDINNNKVEILNQKNNINVTSWALVEYNDYFFFVLNYHDAILQYNIKTKEWTMHTNVFKDTIHTEPNIPNMWSHTVYKELLWITAINSNKILQFNMNTGKIKALQIGSGKENYSAITCDDKYLYIAENHSGNIFYINQENGDKGIYKMPEGFSILEKNGSVSIAHLKLINMRNYIITIPYKGNSMVKINKKTGECSFLIKNFWDSSENIHNGYTPDIRGKAFFAKQIDQKHILVQRLWDGALAKVNVDTDQYTIQYPMMCKESYQKFVMHQTGFEKRGEGNNYVCMESKIFSLDLFLNKLIGQELANLKEQQMETLTSMITNLDGSCGKKVHNFLIDKLELEDAL